jgi:hypothetical protein
MDVDANPAAARDKADPLAMAQTAFVGSLVSAACTEPAAAAVAGRETEAAAGPAADVDGLGRVVD